MGKMEFMSRACGVAWEYFSTDPDRTSLSHIARSGEPPVPSLRFTYSLDGTEPEPDLHKLFGLNIAINEVAAQMR